MVMKAVNKSERDNYHGSQSILPFDSKMNDNSLRDNPYLVSTKIQNNCELCFENTVENLIIVHHINEPTMEYVSTSMCVLPNMS